MLLICIRGILLVTFILVHCLGVKLHDDPVHVNKPPYMQMQACTPLATPPLHQPACHVLPCTQFETGERKSLEVDEEDKQMQ